MVCQVEESASRALEYCQISWFCLPRCWTCEATAPSAVSWKEGGEQGSFKRRRRRERGVMAKHFISFWAILLVWFSFVWPLVIISKVEQKETSKNGQIPAVSQGIQVQTDLYPILMSFWLINSGGEAEWLIESLTEDQLSSLKNASNFH